MLTKNKSHVVKHITVTVPETMHVYNVLMYLKSNLIIYLR